MKLITNLYCNGRLRRQIRPQNSRTSKYAQFFAGGSSLHSPHRSEIRNKFFSISLPFLILALAACQPTVKVEAPDKPIEINLNVKIEHHIKVEIEKDVKKAISSNPDIF